MPNAAIVYTKYDPPNPPTLAQWLAQQAVNYTGGGFVPLRHLDPDICALRSALVFALRGQLGAIRDHLAAHTSAQHDRWDHLYGNGYRSWAASMDAAISMLEEIPLEPNFND